MRPMAWIALGSGLMVVGLAFEGKSHKGSPWHDQGPTLAIGLNSVLLEPSAPGVSTTFTVEYPTQSLTYGFVLGDQHTIIVFPDSALADDGLFTDDEAIVVEQGGVPYGDPLEATFSITESAYFHVLFGPGPENSILVIEGPAGGTVDVTSSNGGSVTFAVSATSGDVHIVSDGSPGLTSFVGWIGVMFPAARSVYEGLGIASGALPPLDSTRAEALAGELVALGQISPGSIPSPFPSGTFSVPFLATQQGLGTLAFMTAHLEPGVYEFSYDRSTGASLGIDATDGIAIRVTKDSVYDDLYGDETEVLASAEFPSSEAAPSLQFEVTEADYYHLMYGPSGTGFVMHLDPDDLIPVSLSTLSGGPASDIRPLGGVNTVLKESGCPDQVYFPCKLVDQDDFHSLGIMSVVNIPIGGPTWGPLIQSLGDDIIGQCQARVPTMSPTGYMLLVVLLLAGGVTTWAQAGRRFAGEGSR